MTRLIYLTLLLWIPCLGLAQSAIFIPFGQTRSEIDTYLAEGQNFIRRTDYRSSDTIVNHVSDFQQVTYLLHDDILYCVEDMRTYADDADAEEVIKACVAYLDLGEFRVRDITDTEYDSHYATIEGGRIVELLVSKTGSRRDRRIVVRLRSTSRLYGPRAETEAYANQLVRN